MVNNDNCSKKKKSEFRIAPKLSAETNHTKRAKTVNTNNVGTSKILMAININ